MIAVALAMMVAAADASGTVAVMRFDGLGVDDKLLDRVDGAVREELATLNVAIVRAAPGPSCEGKVPCIIAAGKKAGAASVIAGSVGLAGDELHATIKLVDVTLGLEKASVDAVGPADQAERRVREAVMKLVAPDKYNTSGAVALTMALAGADIVVDGVPRGTTPLFGPVDGLAPGRRDVEVKYPGKQSWRGFVDVAFDEVYQLEVVDQGGVLVQIPHESGGGSGTAHPVGGGKKDGIPVLTWVGGGVAVVGAGLLVGAGFAFASAQSDFDAFHGGTDVTKARADHNLSMRLAYGILLGSGIATLAGGGVLAAVPLLE